MDSTLFAPTIQHKWIIHNFGHLLTGDSLSTLHSEPFPPECREYQFSLRLLPNYVQQQDNNLSYVSIFLHLEDCAETVLLNTRYIISVVDQNYVKGAFPFAKGSCHGFTTFIPITTLENFLKQFNGNLNIICQIEITNYLQISTLKPPIQNSSSVFDVSPKTSKLSCKWILEEFSLFYYENSYRDKVSLRLRKFSVPENEDLSFYLVLVMTNDKDINLEFISCFLYFESEKVNEVMVHYRLSILNWKGKPCVTGEGQAKLKSKGDGRGATNFISCDELMNLRKGLLPKDKLTIFAQIETFDSEFGSKLVEKFSKFEILDSLIQVPLSKTLLNDGFPYIRMRKRNLNLKIRKNYCGIRNLSIEPGFASLKLSTIFNGITEKHQEYSRYFKFDHKWTINNFSYFYTDDHCSPTFIQSDSFNVDQSKVFLRLYPKCKFNSPEKANCMSLFVHLLSGPNVHIECKLSIIDHHREACNTKSIKAFLTQDNQSFGFDDFVTNNSNVLLGLGYLLGKLTILCEIEILDYVGKTISGASSFMWNFKSWLLSKIGLIDQPSPQDRDKLELIEKSWSYWDASQYVLKHEHQWTIPDFKQYVHHKNICPVDSFTIEHLDSLQLCLKLFPKGQSKKEDHISLFLNLFDCETDRAKILSRLSIRDYQNKLSHSKWIYGKLKGQKGIACERYVQNDYLFEQKHKLLPEDNLTINCEIEVLRILEIESDDSTSHIQTNSNHLVLNSIQSLNATNSIFISNSQCKFGGISMSYN